MVIIHDYIMAVNVPGEWSIDVTLPGYETPCGLAGPVVRHHTDDFVPKQFPRGNAPSTTLTRWLQENDHKKHLDGWTMRDHMFFRHGVTHAHVTRP